MSPQRIDELAREQAKRYEYWRGSTAPLSLDGVIANAIRTAVREALDAVTAELTAIAAKTSYQDEGRTAVDACLYHVTSIRDELTGAPPA